MERGMVSSDNLDSITRNHSLIARVTCVCFAGGSVFSRFSACVKQDVVENKSLVKSAYHDDQLSGEVGAAALCHSSHRFTRHLGKV